MKTVADILDELTVENMDLAEALPDNAVRCYACAHRCLIRESRRGICALRLDVSLRHRRAAHGSEQLP